MKTVVETLETQHRALEANALALEKALKSNQLEEVQVQLVGLCTLLEAHIHLENSQFYPEFVRRAEASGNTQTATVARLFWSNMKLIADGTLAFCHRFEKGIEDRDEFKKQWRTALDVLGRRMVEEERTLHPLYRRLA